MENFSCSLCNESFQTTSKSQRGYIKNRIRKGLKIYCSDTCRYTSMHGDKIKKLKCDYCNNIFDTDLK